jgi:hypothetical protein
MYSWMRLPPFDARRFDDDVGLTLMKKTTEL